MQALAFWRAVTMDQSDFLSEVVDLLSREQIRYCIIGGQGVNAYVEPLVSLDLDLVIALDDLPRFRETLPPHFQTADFPRRLHISAPGSQLRVQIQTDPRYATFVDHASPREVLGVTLPVAAIEDVLQGKIWTAMDQDRRPSKRRKDLLDIERILESFPGLRQQVPAEVLSRLEG